MEGCEGQALVRVTLHNDGRDAWKPDLYGTKVFARERLVEDSLWGF